MEGTDYESHSIDYNRTVDVAQGPRPWIENTFQRRECVRFVSSSKDGNRCACGRQKMSHLYLKEESKERWTPQTHSELMSTDAYGTIEFQGGAHPTKAKYVRLSYDTQPNKILELLQNEWRLDFPKLLISIHGGLANFELQPKLRRMFRKGVLKAAKTTGAWIVSAGINTGVVRHVGESLGTTLVQARNQIVTIGIAPWGVVHNRKHLIGRDVAPYHAVVARKTHNVVLNSNHSYFFLVDNGTVGKYGCEIALRKKLEKVIQEQNIHTKSGVKNNHTPVVSLVLEGGTNTIRTVLECVTDTPPVPVVVVDGSGRAADLLAFTHKYAKDDGTIPEQLRDQLILTIERTFQYTLEQSEKLFVELMLCVKKKKHLTVFRMGEPSSSDIDLAILTALLKAQNASAPDQLSLALAWNRMDIARSHIFTYGQEWPEGALDHAMMDALVNDRVDFVRLLLENGVSMQRWLTIPRLEVLYHIRDQPVTLKNLIAEVTRLSSNKYTLLYIGLIIERLMGPGYRAAYCRRVFKRIYLANIKRDAKGTGNTYTMDRMGRRGTIFDISHFFMALPIASEVLDYKFRYPFHELMIWAILMKRQNMAKFMWEHGEEALAKAIVACKLNHALALEASQDDHDIDVKAELNMYASQFQDLALGLLDHCYKLDHDKTQRLLTYELSNLGRMTCLSLAVLAHFKDLIAHSCCQILLADMWCGGLRMKKYTTFMVIAGVLFFPCILLLDFKSKKDLQLMPQTQEEHLQEPKKDERDSESTKSRHSKEEDEKEEAKVSVKAPKENVLEMCGAMQPEAIIIKQKNTSLKFTQKLYLFYTAPITKFWFHTIGYIFFLFCLAFTVLVDMQVYPNWQEIYFMAFIVTYFAELLRELIKSEPKLLSQKLRLFFSRTWHINDCLAVLLCFVGIAVRYSPVAKVHAKVLYTASVPCWYMRVLHILSINKFLGVYVTMIGRMTKDIINFLVFFVIAILSWGILHQALYFPYEKPSWDTVKRVFMKPYFQMYGELFIDEIDPADCAQTGNCVANQPGQWLAPVTFTLYLMATMILLINLLITVFNNTYREVITVSNTVWKYQRYDLVIQYESKPFLPPPFIALCHLYAIIKRIYRQCRHLTIAFDNGLKVFLSRVEVEKLHDFEEECMEDWFRLRDEETKGMMEERIKVTAERVENAHKHLDDMAQRELLSRVALRTTDKKLTKIEQGLMQAVQYMTFIEKSLLMDTLIPEAESDRKSISNQRFTISYPKVFTRRPDSTHSSLLTSNDPGNRLDTSNHSSQLQKHKHKRSTSVPEFSPIQEERPSVTLNLSINDDCVKHTEVRCKDNSLDPGLIQAELWSVPQQVPTPIINHKRVDYTTITDTIDTSDVTYASPKHSPTSPTRLTVRTKGMVANNLNHMEESEREVLEKQLLKRMRKISLTKSDSMGQLAKKVAESWESSSNSAKDEEGYHGDDNNIHDNMEALSLIQDIAMLSPVKEVPVLSPIQDISPVPGEPLIYESTV